MTQSRVQWKRLGDLITILDRPNTDLEYGIESVRGVSNTKEIQETKANLEGRDLSSFKIVLRDEFIYNRRTTRNGERLGLGFNNTDIPYIFTNDYVHFKITDTNLLDPVFLYIYYQRDEFDRYARYHSWGSATEMFNQDDMEDVMIPVPPIDIQRNIASLWKHLRTIKEENEALAAPLFQLCQSKIQDLKHSLPPICISPYIKEINIRNTKMLLTEDDSRGVNTDKEIQQCKRIGEKIDTYKIVSKDDIVFNCNIKLTQTTTKFAVAQYKEEKPCIVSNFYVVMHCDSSYLLPEYLMLWLVRDEFARYVRFISCSSVRDSFGFEDMQNVTIPIPSLEIQEAIIRIYNCALEAKRIAGDADKLSRDICPSLMQRVING